MEKPVNIAIFASGGGSNTEKIIQHFKRIQKGSISLIVTDNEHAGVLEHAKKNGIEFYVHSKEEAQNGELAKVLSIKKVDFIVLAGYLKKVGLNILDKFPNRIVNIHPSLLPKYGGKGMYGMKVHEAVVAAKERESGLTIHYVNENYDEGDIIAQFKCQLYNEDEPKALQQKVLALEHIHYPQVIEQLIKEL